MPVILALLALTALTFPAASARAATVPAANLPAATVAAGTHPAKTVPLAQIPLPFRGLWMAEPWQCQADATDESWLRITADDLRFYESAGPVLAVVRRGRREIGVISELSGEGSTWLHLLRLRLDETGTRLGIAAVGEEGEAMRVRCVGG